MDRSFHLSAVRAVAAAARRIVGTVNLGDFPIFILAEINAFYKVSLHQAHFIAREHSEILLRRVLHKIIPFDVEFTGKGDGAAPQRLIFRVVWNRKLLCLSLRVIINNQLYRIQDRIHSGNSGLQIIPDAVLQHRIVCGAVGLRNSSKADKLLY